MVYSKQEEMRGRLAQRMSELLTQEPKEEQHDQMLQIENVLEEAGNWLGDLDKSSPQKFSQDLFREGALSDLVDKAVQSNFEPAEVDMPLDLVQNFIPSDGHLD